MQCGYPQSTGKGRVCSHTKLMSFVCLLVTILTAHFEDIYQLCATAPWPRMSALENTAKKPRLDTSIDTSAQARLALSLCCSMVGA